MANEPSIQVQAERAMIEARVEHLEQCVVRLSELLNDTLGHLLKAYNRPPTGEVDLDGGEF